MSVKLDASQVNFGGKDDRKESLSKDRDDYLELVECQDIVVVSHDKKENVTMQVKIVTAGNKSHIMSYNLDKDREVTWIGATRDSKIFYGTGGQSCFVQDEEFGIIDLHTKE